MDVPVAFVFGIFFFFLQFFVLVTIGNTVARCHTEYEIHITMTMKVTKNGDGDLFDWIDMHLLK